MISGRLGNWEIGLAAVSAHGYQGAGWGSGSDDTPPCRNLTEVRTRYGKMIYPDVPRDCFSVLRDNLPLLMVVDQWVREGGIPVPFFGEPAHSAPRPPSSRG